MSIWDASLETANRWYDISWYGLLLAGVIAALAAGATVIFLFLQFWSSGVRERYAELRTAGLEAQAEHARADVARANADIARANQTIAEAQRDTAQARVEQERLKAQLAWRVLPLATIENLQRRLTEQPGTVNIVHVSGDTEAQYFAIQFANIFAAAGWQIGFRDATYVGHAVFGVWISGGEPQMLQRTRDAFTGAGVPFAIDPLPREMLSSGTTLLNAITVLIGSKRPPA